MASNDAEYIAGEIAFAAMVKDVPLEDRDIALLERLFAGPTRPSQETLKAAFTYIAANKQRSALAWRAVSANPSQSPDPAIAGQPIFGQRTDK
jgi:hypothetical protein